MRERIGKLGRWLGRAWMRCRGWLGGLSPGKKALIWVNVGLLVLMVGLLALQGWVTAAPDSQHANSLWANGLPDARYAQISLFVGDSAALGVGDIYTLRDAMDSKLRESSLEARTEEARLWLDAYSVTKRLGVHTGGAGQVEVQVTGVGGDFFFIHGYELLYGQYLGRDDLLQDLVVIDDLLAWKLFGASNVVGSQLTVDGRPCYVAGVVRRTESWPESKTYGDECRMFIAFGMMEQISPGIGATCYEMILPDPVTGFAMSMTEQVVTVDENQRELVENSARYGTLTLLKKLRGFSLLGTQTKAVALPYWENAARVAENVALLLMALALACAVMPAVCLIIVIVRLWRQRGRLVRYIKDEYRRRQMLRWQSKQAEKQASDEPEPDNHDAPKEEVLL